MESDRFNLERFVDAQAGGVFERALEELRDGRKRTHWMWFIFPQHRDLGRSGTAKFYGLSGREEAAAYLAHPVHPVLGMRLRQAAAAVLPHLEAGRSAVSVMGPIDAMKLRSSMAIFAGAAPDEPLFRRILAAIGAEAAE